MGIKAILILVVISTFNLTFTDSVENPVTDSHLPNEIAERTSFKNGENAGMAPSWNKIEVKGLILTDENKNAQYCVGQTKYLPRDAKGRILKKKHLKNLKVLTIDGKHRELVKKQGYFNIHYDTHNGLRNHRIYFKKNLTFTFGFCNQIRDLTLEYKGKTMMLIFDVGILNSNLYIEALPFQNGTFELTSLKCKNGKRPPRTDNENQGFCTVSSENWKKISDKIVPIKKICCKGKARFGYWYH